MYRWKRAKYILLALLIVFSLCGCGQGQKEQPSGAEAITSLGQLEQARIGMQTGASFHSVVQERFPEAELQFFDTYADLILNLEQGKISGFPVDGPTLAQMQTQAPWLTCVEEPVAVDEYGALFPKTPQGEKLKKEFDAFFASIRQDGTLEEIQQLWLSGAGKDLDYSSLPATNGTLRMAVDVECKPFVYLKNGNVAGYEVDLAIRFCEAYGYGLEIDVISFGAIITSVVSGKYDFAAAAFTITEERAQSVLFSEPTYQDNIVVAVRGEAEEEESFFQSVVESFENTFIREDRWKMILQGVGTTVLITVLAAVLGTALGFGLYLLCRTGNRLARAVARVYSRLIDGLPVVVLLMLLFYVVFGKSDISGIWIAVMGFALTTGSFVHGTMAVSVDSIDKGQMEAAQALGYTERHAFFKMILPQAMRLFLPAYQGEMVSLVKATAVVGYIAVQDLTKVSDIIRSNTYEAFFPLIATAMIYMLLTWLVAIFIGKVKLRFEPKSRSVDAILKGVER